MTTGNGPSRPFAVALFCTATHRDPKWRVLRCVLEQGHDGEHDYWPVEGVFPSRPTRKDRYGSSP